MDGQYRFADRFDAGAGAQLQERIIFDNRTQMNADNQDFKYFDGLVGGGDY